MTRTARRGKSREGEVSFVAESRFSKPAEFTIYTNVELQSRLAGKDAPSPLNRKDTRIGTCWHDVDVTL